MKLSVLKRAQDYLEGIKKNPLSFLEDADVTEDEKGAITITVQVPQITTPPAAKDKPRQRQPRVKGDKNILATFVVSTPMVDGPTILQMGKEEVKSTNLKSGVLELLGKCNINPETIPAFPDSEGKRQIVGILKG